MSFIKYIICLLSLVSAFRAYASIEITEILYDPKGSNTNRQWIEIYNSDTNPVLVDASTWRFNDGSGHYMNDKVDFSIPAGSYVVITGNKSVFLSEHPSFTGVVIDTSMSLDKDGDTVALTQSGTTIASASYTSSMGGAEDGNSLQKINGSFAGALPTPGAPNAQTASSLNPPPVESSNTEDEETEENSIITIATKIISPTRITTNIPFTLLSKTTTSAKETLNVGRFVWNFGNGFTVVTENADPFLYAYKYPGEYVITLSFYNSVFSDKPEATDRIVVRVVPPGIHISAVGDGDDVFVELENISGGDVDISTWVLRSPFRTFRIPDGSILLNNKKIKISSRITGFTPDDISGLVLESPSGEVLDSYKKVTTSKFYSSGAEDVPMLKNVTPEKSEKVSKEINLNDLVASAEKLSNKKDSINMVSIVLLAMVIGVGIMAVVLIGKQKNNEIELEDDIRAEDMTIIE